MIIIHRIVILFLCFTGLRTLGVWIEFFRNESSENNLLLTTIPAGFSSSDLIINEIMYDPLAGRPEWVELYNRSTSDIDLNGWTITDSHTSNIVPIAEQMTVVPSSGYVVVAEEPLSNVIPDEAVVIIIHNLPALNNDSDSVVLFDPSDSSIDRVDYIDEWGGGDGLSLERINPSLPSGDASNWSGCVSAEGATPGRQNSIYTSRLPSEAVLSASPNPFSPDQDGLDDVTIISYRLPMKTSRANLRIYDIHGRRIRTLMGASPSGSQGSIIWDGRDDQGGMARIGIYVIYIEGLSGKDGIVASAKSTVVLAGRL